MEQVPKAMRLAIAIGGRTNVGKSSFLNLISGQESAITSPVAGTTTDVVEKSMELRPIGPVLFLDTAGLDDDSELGARRIEKTRNAFQRADILVLVATANQWAEPEESVLRQAAACHIGAIVVFNQIDRTAPSQTQIDALKSRGIQVLTLQANDPDAREKALVEFTQAVEAALPEDFRSPPPLLGDLLKPGQTVLLLVPIDIQAPQGRLILPQQQCLRDALDCDCVPVVCKENAYLQTLANLKTPPALVICDSQVVDLMVKHTPQEIPCTTFSILFSRLKGDMNLLLEGAERLKQLRPGDRILMAEACTHHASCEDIGRVKIPRWLQQKVGGELHFDFFSGHDYPKDLSAYALIIHCGSCMLNRRETLSRMYHARQSGVPITNYGMCISFCQGVLERVTQPFRQA